MIIFVDNFKDNVEARVINELDLQSGIISIGNYHTHLPISSLEYREKNKEHYLVKIEFTKTETEVHFGITDEYGNTYSLIATEEDMEHPAILREIAIIKTLRKEPQMTEKRLTEIMKSDSGDWEGCNALTGLNIIAKYLPEHGVEGAEHDIIFAATISDILEAGLTEEDAKKLRSLNWMIDETSTGLACFV